MKIINKIAAVYLWWYSLVFIVVVADLKIGFLSVGIKNILARYPYQWDFELMFAMLFVVWGIFLWRDVKLSRFSGYLFLSQGIAMILLAFLQTGEGAHFIMDSILWLALGLLLVKTKNYE